MIRNTDVCPDRVNVNYVILITLAWLRLGQKSRGETLEGEMLNMIINLAISYMKLLIPRKVISGKTVR